jgi:hypothetical protein
MKINLLIIALLAGFAMQAQVDKKIAKEVQKEKDDGKEIKDGWTRGASFNVAFNQASLTNWFAGGEKNSMGLSTQIKANANKKKGNNLFKSNVDAAYGLIKTSSNKDIRKTDDRWALTSSFNRKASKYWYYTLAAQVKSQFGDGYTYTDNVRNEVVSTFFAPGDIKLGIGFTYQKTADFSAYLSPLTAKLNLKLDRRFLHRTIFAVDSGKTYSFDLGAFARIDFTRELKKDLKYTMSLDAFYGYVLQNYNFYFGNMFNWKLNKYFGVSFGLDIAFDNTQPSYTYTVVNEVSTKLEGPAKLQIKQVFGLGFNYSL